MPLEATEGHFPEGTDPKKVEEYREQYVDCYLSGMIDVVHITSAERCEDYAEDGSLPLRGRAEIIAKLASLARERDLSRNRRSRGYIRAVAQIKILRWVLQVDGE